jgi:hypothetical protein
MTGFHDLHVESHLYFNATRGLYEGALKLHWSISVDKETESGVIDLKKSTADKINRYIILNRPLLHWRNLFNFVAVASLVGMVTVLSTPCFGAIFVFYGLLTTACVSAFVANYFFSCNRDLRRMKHDQVIKLFKDVGIKIIPIRERLSRVYEFDDRHDNFERSMTINSKQARQKLYSPALEFDKEGLKAYLLKKASDNTRYIRFYAPGYKGCYDEIQSDLYSKDLIGLTTFGHKDYDREFYEEFLRLNPTRQKAIPSYHKYLPLPDDPLPDAPYIIHH